MRNKITILLVLVLTMSCSNDDDSDDFTGILGTWQITSLTLESTNDYNGDGIANPNLLEETQCSEEDQFIFNSDGTGVIVRDAENISLDAENDNNFNLQYVYECVEGIAFDIPMTWNQDGNTVTVTVSGFDDTIFTLSGNTLTAIEENSFQVPVIFEEGGYDLILEDTITVFTKL